MPKRGSRLRAAALMAPAALVLHELRYLIGPHPQQELGRDAHAYIPLAGALVSLLLAIAAGQLVARLARARRDGSAGPSPGGFAPAWAVATAGLLGTYAVQELLEGALAGGHLGGLLGPGAAWVVPLALVLGALVALACRGAYAAVRALARRSGRTPPSRGRSRVLRPAGRVVVLREAVLARNLAGRAPPLAS
jgi:hypothetical protein